MYIYKWAVTFAALKMSVKKYFHPYTNVPAMKNNIRQYAPLTLLLCVYSIFILGCKEQSKPTVTKVVQKELFEKLFDLSTLNDSLLTAKVRCLLSESRLSSSLLTSLSTSNRISIDSDTTETSYSTYCTSKTIYRIVYCRVVEYTPTEKFPWDCSILVGYPETYIEDGYETKGFYILTRRVSGVEREPYRIESNLSRNSLSSILKLRAYHYARDSSTIELDYSHSLIDNEWFFRKIKIGNHSFDSYLSGIIKCY